MILPLSLFFLICVGLGYPALNRYNPRLAGNPDSAQYYKIVLGGPQDAMGHFRYRVLIPYFAKPIYWLAKDRVGTWDPVFFSLLVVNSFFVASTACLLVNVGYQIVWNWGVALLGAMLYLLNFTVLNGHLTGLVDAGEGYLIMMVAWTLFQGKLHLLPVIGILGALAKETFVPLGGVFAIAWWIVDRRELRLSGLCWIAAMIAAGLFTVTILQSSISGYMVWPWDVVISEGSMSGFSDKLLRCISDQNFWYVFFWLLPLGIWRLASLPQPWVLASAGAAVMALVLGAYADSGGNVARAMFNSAGPALSLSIAVLLTDKET